MRALALCLVLGIAVAGCSDSSSSSRATVTGNKNAVSEGIYGAFDQSLIQRARDYMAEHRVKTTRTTGIVLRVSRGGKAWSAALVISNGHLMVWHVDDPERVPEANLLYDPGDYLAIAEAHGWGSAQIDTRKTSILRKAAVDPEQP